VLSRDGEKPNSTRGTQRGWTSAIRITSENAPTRHLGEYVANLATAAATHTRYRGGRRATTSAARFAPFKDTLADGYEGAQRRRRRWGNATSRASSKKAARRTVQEGTHPFTKMPTEPAGRG
jgi:hypothetical protein